MNSREMEKTLKHIESELAKLDLKDEKEMDKALQKIIAKHNENPNSHQKPETDFEKADYLISQAVEESNPKKREKLLKSAIMLLMPIICYLKIWILMKLLIF